MRVILSVALILVAAVVSVPARAVAGGVRQDKPADVAGKWAIQLDINGTVATPTVTLKQDGETLTGTYASQVFGEQNVTGTIKGNAVTFGFTGTMEGNAVKVTYTGTVQKDTMQGKVTIGDLGEATFTAKRQ